LVKADLHKRVSVRITYTRTGYNALVQTIGARKIA
jgi:hypothetical protein